MRTVKVRRAQLSLAVVFAAGFVIQLSVFLLCFATNKIYADNLQATIEALVKLYSAPLTMITAALFATPSTSRTAQVDSISFWAAVVACAVWNVVLMILTLIFLGGSERIETFVPTLAGIGATINWLTGGALAFFFVKNAGGAPPTSESKLMAGNAKGAM